MVFMDLLNKRINIITGHYGSGKTNLAVNLALNAAKNGNKLCLADLDIVNPYFRAADMTGILENAGVKVIAPIYAGSNLDIPAIPPAMYSLFEDRSRRVIIDVGGDDAGAAALGRFTNMTLAENDYDHFYVINARRILTRQPEESVEIMREIELMCRLPVTAIVNNTNLAKETDAGIIRESLSFASEVARLSSLPIAFTSVKSSLADELSDIQNLFPVEIYVKTPWD